MKTKKPPSTSAGTAEVEAFMAQLEHPLKAQIEAVRRIVCGVSPEIGEAIKWNAPSFRTTEFFATTHLRSRDQVQLIFHLGAKVRAGQKKLTLADPNGLVKWLARDRCIVSVGSLADNEAALAAIVRAWIAFV